MTLMVLPNGLARFSIVSDAPLVRQQEEMFHLLGRLVQHFEREARGQRSYDPLIGRTLKDTREALRLAILAVADQIGKRQSVVLGWESGSECPARRACMRGATPSVSSVHPRPPSSVLSISLPNFCGSFKKIQPACVR